MIISYTLTSVERSRFVIRDETFGGTLYDRNLLKHQFISRDEINSGISTSGFKVENPEIWKGNIDNIPEGLLYAPTRIYFELTRECNLRCLHCFNSSAKPIPSEMNTEEMMLSLEGLRKNNVFDIRFTGGELTVRPDWFEILKRAKDLGFTVSANTNGVYKNFDETIKKLTEAGLL